MTDDQGSTAVTDTVMITVEASDLAPTASDSIRTVTYAWTRASGTEGGTGSPVTLNDTTVLRPTFPAPTLTAGADDVTYIFTLTVTDDQGSDPVTDTVMITVEAPDLTPIAGDAGNPQTVDSG